MLVAFITNHMKNGFFIFRPGEGYEYVMMLTLVARRHRHHRARANGASTGTSSALQDLWGWPGFGIARRRGRPRCGRAARRVYWRPEKPAAADNS